MYIYLTQEQTETINPELHLYKMHINYPYIFGVCLSYINLLTIDEIKVMVL